MPLAIYIILGIFLFIWLLNIIAAIIMLCILNKKITRRYHAINIMLQQLYDSLSNIANLIVDNGGEISSRADDFLNKIDKVDLRDITIERRNRFLSNASSIKEELIELCQKNNLLENPMYITLINSIHEIEEQYRKSIAFYNSDIEAYNYWVRFIPIRLFSKLFRIKLKEKL